MDILVIGCGVSGLTTGLCLQEAGHRVHNYGHGGAGITLSWGCASEVVELIEKME